MSVLVPVESELLVKASWILICCEPQQLRSHSIIPYYCGLSCAIKHIPFLTKGTQPTKHERFNMSSHDSIVKPVNPYNISCAHTEVGVYTQDVGGALSTNTTPPWHMQGLGNSLWALPRLIDSLVQWKI